MNVWLAAIRPKTLVAGAAPVVLGSALAFHHHELHLPSALIALACAVLIQIASNFINELEDFKRGADEHRVGPLRAVTAGLITPASMKRASWMVVGAAFLLGQPLVFRAGWPVLVIGVACLVAAWLYTGGPFPLAYKGLGDVFAFVFFGVIAVVGTYYVHTGTWSADAFVVSIAPGCLAANILGVNNLRDIPTDARVGKRTIAVRIGATGARLLYTVLTAVAILAPSLILGSVMGAWMYLPLAAMPVGIIMTVLVWRRSGAELNTVLGGTAALYVLYTLLASMALVMSRVHAP
ncbi:MAG: 1,4-dihydroxy-2-naphthoate polyprenyltransferase [Candidatus Kapabacteria bacterium]|nr:1,4-dihydroxy-2-naphthoate polyprenyltransferase [Candidatus Kapabacteria bacterium]